MRDPNGTYLPEVELRHRGVYELAARKLRVGIWDADARGFLGLYEYVEYEYIWTEQDGTASAVRLLAMLPATIELRSHVPSTCSQHDRETLFRKRDDGTPFGDWYHADDGSLLADEDIAMARAYQPMYDYLASFDPYTSNGA